jgi:hypothetical protein
MKDRGHEDCDEGQHQHERDRATPRRRADDIRRRIIGVRV